MSDMNAPLYQTVLGLVALYLMLVGARVTLQRIGRAMARAGRAFARKVTDASRSARSWCATLVAGWKSSLRDWRTHRERKATRRREGRERLLVEAQRELASVVASQCQELAALRARLDRNPPDPSAATNMPAAARSWC